MTDALRSGELALRKLPAVLLDLLEAKATGRLTLRRGRVSKTVDVADGDPVSATSTNRDETLGHFLVGTGIITSEQHRTAVGNATQRGIRVGAALISMGVLTPDRLNEQLINQTRHKLVLALRWPQGAWRFDPVEPETLVDGMKLRMIDVVLTGLRDTASEGDDAHEALQRLDGQAVELTDRGRLYLADLRRVFGIHVLEAIVAGGRIDDIERAATDPIAGRRVVDALLASGSVITKAPALGLGAAPVRPRGGSTLPPRSKVQAAVGGGLFDTLFEDGTGALGEGAAPVEIIDDNDSGAVAGADASAIMRARDEATTARRDLLTEYLRLQGTDHYAALLVGQRSTPIEISAAVTERQSKFARDFYARFPLGPDQTKLDHLHAAYERARDALLDDRKRRAYDRELAGGDLAEPPSLGAELGFRGAEDKMARGEWAAALPILEATVRSAPGTADYIAALGWARWQAGGRDGAAADSARNDLNAALEINPDHAAAHEYKGRISAALGVDPSEASLHLERAVELDPSRTEALQILETGMLARGEVRQLERLYKRLIYKVTGQSPAAEVRLWTKLGALYAEHLDDPRSARLASSAAERIGGPAEVSPPPSLEESVPADSESVKSARDKWDRDRSNVVAGAELISAAQQSGALDTAFLAASAMVALGAADATSTATYQRFRSTDTVRPNIQFELEHWAQLRHPDDIVEIGALVELLAPAVRALAPMTLADLDVDPSERIEDRELPTVFARLRLELAGLLGVEPAAVYARADLGTQIHVAAADTPVLLAGDDALTAPDRPELVFRLARAMTFLFPGRAVGASRPGRVLKAVVLAMFRDASGADLGSDDPLAVRADAAIAALDETIRVAARGTVLRLVARQPSLNLSRWSRALSRTADRVGLLLSGDVPAAVQAAREVGADVDELIAFATSRPHQALRAAVGLAIPAGATGSPRRTRPA